MAATECAEYRQVYAWPSKLSVEVQIQSLCDVNAFLLANVDLIGHGEVKVLTYFSQHLSVGRLTSEWVVEVPKSKV